jgi:hypothetical protein
VGIVRILMPSRIAMVTIMIASLVAKGIRIRTMSVHSAISRVRPITQIRTHRLRL